MPKKVMPLTDAKVEAIPNPKRSINLVRLEALARVPIPRVPFSGAKIRNEVPADIRDALPR